MATGELAAAAERAAGLAEGTRWYLFGSASRDGCLADDLDVLIVYDHGDISNAKDLAGWLETQGPVPPADLVILSEEEERQTNFIERESAGAGIPFGTARALAGLRSPLLGCSASGMTYGDSMPGHHRRAALWRW